MIKERSFVLMNVSLILLITFLSLFVIISNRNKSIRENKFVFVSEEIVVQRTTAIPTAKTKTLISPKVKEKTTPRTSVVEETAKTPVVPKQIPINPPKILSQAYPVYPQKALEAGIEGMVIVAAFVATNGTVAETKVKTSSGDKDLDNSAIAAVSSWTFSPATQGEKELSVWYEVPIRFQIKD